MRQPYAVPVVTILACFILCAPAIRAQGIWVDQSPGGLTVLWSCAFKDASTGWVVGDNGKILRTDNGGTSWTTQTSGVSGYLSGIAFVGDEGWACGGNGAIIHTTNGGANWNPQSSGGTASLYDMCMTSATTGLVCGAGNTILLTTNGGATWSPATVPGTSVSLYGIYAIGSTVYACGQTGRILKSTDGGATWNQLTSGYGGTLEGIHFVNSTTGYVTGDAGTVLKTTDGTNFTPCSTPATTRLYACWFADQNNGWAIASGASIWKTSTGGGSWVQQTSPVSTPMYGMDFANSTNGWAVGFNGKIIHYTTSLPKISGPVTHDWGTLVCTNQKTDTIKIANIGTGPLSIINAQISGPDAGEFTLQSPTSFPVTVQPGDSLGFRILWTAGPAGAKSAGLFITSNDPDTAVWPVHFTATRGTLLVAANPGTLDFGPVCIGANAKLTTQLIPAGSVPGTVTEFFRVSGDSDFVLISPPLPAPLPFGIPFPADIQFRPTRAGAFNAVYAFRIEPCDLLVQVTLKGQGLQSLAQILPSAGYDFGLVEVGKSASLQFKIQGGGNTPTHVTDISILPSGSGFALTALPGLPLSLAPAQERTFTVQFSPTAEMPYAASVCVRWDAQCADSLCVPVAGRGYTRPRIVAPAAHAFPSLVCGDTAEDTIIVRNAGGAPLEIASASFTGPQAARFTLESPAPPFTVPPGDSVKLVIRFTDNSAGLKSASLVLTHNDTPNNPSTIALTITQSIASFVVQGDSTQPIESCVGSGTARSLKLFNNGSVPVTIRTLLPIQNGAVFHVSGNTLPVTIDPNQNSPFEINFTPLATGLITGKILIKADPCSLASILSIEGNGIRTSAQTSPADFQFGDVKIGTSADRQVEITNTGTLSTIVDEIFLSPPTPGLQIVQQPTLPLRFNTGDKFTVGLRYTPAATGAIAASLCFRTGTPCLDTICVPVSGNGIAASISVTRASLYYALSPCTLAPSCDTITLANAGSSPVDVTDLAIQPPGVFSLQPKPALPLTLRAGESRQLSICASALFAGSQTALLTIASTDPQRPTIEIPLSARRDSVNIQLTASPVDFGTLVSCDSAKELSVRFANTGTIGEIITSSPVNEPAFSLPVPFPLLLQAGESRDIVIRFSPTQYRAYRDSLLLRTRTCSSALRIDMIGERALPVYTRTPSTVSFPTVDLGSTVTQTVRVTNGNPFAAHLAGTTISPPVPGLSIATGSGGDFDPGGFADFTLQFTPADTLPRSAQICFIIDRPCPDTICVSFSGRGIRGSVSVSKQQMQFAAAAQCEFRRDTLLCRNGGGGSISLTGSSITGTSAASFLLLNPTTTPETLAPGASRAYVVEFRPTAAPDGILTATLEIRTTDPQRPRIDVSLQGERITQQLPAIAMVDFGAIAIGFSRTLTLTLRNPGTARFCLREIRLPSAVTTAAAFPICLDPGEQTDIPLTFAPADTVRMQATATLIAEQPCPDSTQFTVAGQGLRSEIVQTPAVHFGTVPSCATTPDTILVENNFAFPVDLVSVGRIGADLQWFDIVQPLSFPVTIPANGKLSIIISFHPQAGNDGFKQVTFYTEVRVDTSILRFLTQVDATGETPVYTLTGISFAPTMLGDTTLQSVTIPNSRGYPLLISSFVISDPAFSLVSTAPPLPATLKPGESLRADLRFIPAAVRSYAAIMTMNIGAPCALTAQASLDGSGLPPNMLAVNASLAQYQGRPDEIIILAVRLDRDVGSALVQSWSGDLSFNRTMLYPLEAVRDSTLSANQTVTFVYDQARGTVTLAGSGAPLSGGAAPLIRLRAKVLVGNDLETPLTLSSSFDFTSGSARITQRSAGLFRLVDYCQAADRLLRLEGFSTLHQNNPNPFGEGSQAREPGTSIVFETACDGQVTLSLFDASGRRIRTPVDEWKPAGRYAVSIDAAALPSGVYYYTLQSGRFQDLKKMILVR